MNKILLLLFSLSLFISSIYAQKSDTITITNLDGLWKIVLQNNPTQKIYSLKKEQSNDDYKASQSFYYPQAAVGFNGQDNLKLSVTPVPGALLGHPGETVFLQFGKHYTYNTGLTVTKDLFDWQAMLQSKIAKENSLLINVQQDAYIQTLKTQLGQYYYSLLVAKASLLVTQEDKSIADSMAEKARQKFKEGLTDASAVNLALINQNNVAQNNLQSQQLYNQALSNIKLLAGLPATTSFSFGELETEPHLTESIVLLGMDKTLVPYTNSITLTELQRKAQAAATLPKLSATGYLGFQQFKDNFEISFAKNAWTDYQYIGLALNWPLFTGFANTNKLKSINTQKKIAEQNYTAAKEQSSINDSLLLTNYQSFATMTITAKNTFELYGKNRELAKQKYEEGLLSLDSYLKTFQDYLIAENAYLNSLSNLLTTKAAIEARNTNTISTP